MRQACCWPTEVSGSPEAGGAGAAVKRDPGPRNPPRGHLTNTDMEQDRRKLVAGGLLAGRRHRGRLEKEDIQTRVIQFVCYSGNVSVTEQQY